MTYRNISAWSWWIFLHDIWFPFYEWSCSILIWSLFWLTHCLQAQTCQVAIPSLPVSPSSIQQALYNSSPGLEQTQHLSHIQTTHVPAQLHPCTPPHHSQVGPASLSWYVPHRDRISSWCWTGCQWMGWSSNELPAFCGGIWYGMWSRTCQSSSPIILRFCCSMTGTKPFL